MGKVNADDDVITRWVIFHYRVDPLCHERRDTVAVACDNESEFHVDFSRRANAIAREINVGT